MHFIVCINSVYCSDPQQVRVSDIDQRLVFNQPSFYCGRTIFGSRLIFRFAEKMAGILFEDIFDVKDIDPDGKKFDRGERNIIFILELKKSIIENNVLHMFCCF